MTKNHTQNALHNLTSSIAFETKNPLSLIKSHCKLIKKNLDQTLELIDLIDVSSSRGLGIIDIILANATKEKGEEKIDKSKFVYIAMSTIIEAVMREYAFKNDEERMRVVIDLKDDFDFKGDETLMIFVIFILLRNSLIQKTKIKIWLDGGNRCLYFQDNRTDIIADNVDLSFCKKVMKAFGGDICVKSVMGKGTEFCLRFE